MPVKIHWDPVSIRGFEDRLRPGLNHLAFFAGGLAIKEQLLSLEGNRDAKKLKTTGQQRAM